MAPYRAPLKGIPTSPASNVAVKAYVGARLIAPVTDEGGIGARRAYARRCSPSSSAFGPFLTDVAAAVLPGVRLRVRMVHGAAESGGLLRRPALVRRPAMCRQLRAPEHQYKLEQSIRLAGTTAISRPAPGRRLAGERAAFAAVTAYNAAIPTVSTEISAFTVAAAGP